MHPNCVLHFWKVLPALFAAVVLSVLYYAYAVDHLGAPAGQQQLPVPLAKYKMAYQLPHPTAQAQASPQVTQPLRKAGLYVTRSTNRVVGYSCKSNRMCGGWADRQKGIVLAFLISVMMNRKFRIDMPRPCHFQFFLTPNEVDWLMRPGETQGHSVSEINALDATGLAFVDKLLKHEDMLIKDMDADYVFITTNMETALHMLMHHRLAKSVAWLANETSPAEIYRKSLLKLFTLSSGLRKTLEVAMESRPPGTKLVCAQVRVGGARGDYNDSETFNSMENVKSLLKFFSSFNDSRNYRMYFASDSQQVVDLSAAEFPELIIHIPGPITHVDKSKGSDACAGFGHAILEQTVLSTCDVLVISESGLGKIAAFLRNSDDELYLFHDGKVERFRRDMKFVNRGVGWHIKVPKSLK